MSWLLDYYSIWAFFASLGLIFAVACLPILKVADIPPIQSRNRLWNIDGLRGFLALAVVFHHIAIYHQFLTDGVWGPPPTRFYAALGPIGVSMFFMITGFLFWSSLLRQSGKSNWAKLYIGRIFRIGPLYLVAVFAVFLCVTVSTHFTLRVSGLALLYESIRWLSLGIFLPVDLNGYRNTSQLLAGVTWSIQWEWAFYLSLPVIGFAARKRLNDLFFIIPSILICMVRHATRHSVKPRTSETMVFLFLLGMLSASLERRGLLSRLNDGITSALVFILLGFVFAFADPYGNIPVLLLGCVFYLICSGTSLFGLLLSRPARRLGDISYGIYLLQGLALGAVYNQTTIHSLAVHSAAYHWLFGLAGSILLVLVATIAHAGVELPGIRLGKQIAKKLVERRSVTTFEGPS